MQRGDPFGPPSFASQSQNKFVLNYKLIIMRNFRLFLAVFLAACTFASCQEEIIKDAIVLDSSSSDDLIQVLESGETRGSSITFTTSGAWTSEIKSVAPRTKASPDWISLKPDHGNAAGDYTVDVVLSENETYSDRAAEIIIKSGDKSITMDITQKASPFVPVTAVKLSASSLALTEGDVARLTATVEPADATDKTVVWSSDSPEIAEVDQEGNVTAKSEGEAVITAVSGDVSGTCTVVVSKRIIPVTSVTVIPEYVELTEGDSKALMVRIQPSDATDKTVVWSSDAPEIVEVSDGGRITAMSEGTAVVTASSGDVSGTCTVVVSKPYIPVSSVKINLPSLELTQGEVVSLTVTVEPANATDKTVVWRSDDSDVASVDQEGNVTAVSQGNTVITAECGDMSATCVVTVFPAELHYVDEYGIDHGPGILISTYSYGDIVWAPVNCGYHATDYKYGKLYQWGRKYGQGYDGSDAIAPVIAEGGVTLAEGQDPDNANTYFKGAGNDWLGESDDKLWNSGTEDAPVKTENDPCPDGWRVPTYNELKSIQSRKSSWTTNDEGQNGYWFTDSNDPSQTFFMPAAGLISGASWKAGKPDDRGSDGYYWSSKPYNNGAANMQSISKYSVSGSSSYRCYGYSVRCVKE